MKREFLQGFVFVLMTVTLLFSNPAFAYSLQFEENPPANDLADNSGSSGTFVPIGATPETPSNLNSNNSSNINNNTVGTTNESSCVVSKLNPAEAKNILGLTHDGFSGDKLSDGIADTNADKRDLNGLNLIASDNDGKTALKVTPPTQATSAERYAVFDGREMMGPWGVGLVLDDTLRVGRCEYSTTDQDNCRIMGDGTQYRTSGTGVKSGFVNSFTSLKDLTVRKAQGLSEAEYQKMQNSAFDNDTNNLQVNYTQPSEKIKNSFLVKSYTARKSSNCNNANCIIATYSGFDKYFNSWFSAEMIVSSFGPTMLHKASTLMGWANSQGGRSGNTWMSKTGKFFEQKMDGLRKLPLEAIGAKRYDAYEMLKKEYPSLRPYFDKMLVEKKLFSTDMAGYGTELFKPDSPLYKMSLDEKKAFFKATDHLRSWIRESNTAVKGYKAAYESVLDNPLASAAEKSAAQLEYGRKVADKMAYVDDCTPLDWPQWFQSQGSLTDFATINIKKKAFGATGGSSGIVNLGADGSFNMKKLVLRPFHESGNWSKYINSVAGDAFEVDARGSLLLYELKRDGKPLTGGIGVSVNDLIQRVGQRSGEGVVMVRLPNVADSLELNDATIKLIEKMPNITTVDLYTSAWVPKMTTAADGTMIQATLTPQEFAQRLTQDRVVSRINTAETNLDGIINTIRENPEFSQRKSWSLFDEQIKAEKDFMLNYYKQPYQTGIWKGTVLPVLYWNFKRGAGIEQISGYMLPDKWTTIQVTPGADPIYADSYIDFFANEGSDQGDLFMKAINNGIFLWKYMADQFTKEEVPVFNDYLSRASGSGEGVATGGFNSKSVTRDTVTDLAFYSHNENCSGCSGKISVKNDYLTIDGMDLPTNIQAFLVEAVEQDKALKNGTTLIAYAHHADLKGKSGEIEGGNINLVQARKEGTTCDQALREVGLGWASPKVSGLILAAGESMAYGFLGFGWGITASVAQPVLFTRKLQDCVDDAEGYYIHLFAPPSYNATKPKQAVSNETIANTVSSMSDKLVESASKTDTPISQAMGKIGEDFKNFASQAKNDSILQANLQLFPPSSGTITGKEVFYIWYKDSAAAASYKTEGKQVITDGNKNLEINNATGEITYNGKTLLSADKEDHTRMATTPSDNRIPGIVVPMTLNKISAPGTDAAVFRLLSSGQVAVIDNDVLACIQKAVKDQTGIEYTGNELTNVFGKLSGINSEAYGKIFARDGKIYLEGTGPRIVGGSTSAVTIDGTWQTKFADDGNKNVEAGKFKGMTFEHGSIVLKEETNELIVWLRQHKESVLSNKEVSGLKAKVSSVIDPDTGCETPAINLEAIGQAGDELGQQRVKNFNTSMNHLGPFTQFVTDSKIYEFYSQPDPKTGECKEYFRIINKNTGEVEYGGEIKGGIKQAGDGTLSFETTDGRQHELNFSAENGVPKVSYNNGPLETLRSAQGPKGSFWYDPNTGLWYPENGLQIPLNQAFKDNGTMFGSDGKGGVAGTATNPMTFNLGPSQGQGINLPSLPEDLASMALFISGFLLLSFFFTRKK